MDDPVVVIKDVDAATLTSPDLDLEAIATFSCSLTSTRDIFVALWNMSCDTNKIAQYSLAESLSIGGCTEKMAPVNMVILQNLTYRVRSRWANLVTTNFFFEKIQS